MIPIIKSHPRRIKIKSMHIRSLGKQLDTFKIKVIPRKVMGDYITLHGLVPQNELPKHLRGKIPENEIWMREDAYKNDLLRSKILYHEKVELQLMLNYGYTYKEAHSVAEIADGPG